jgi:16S rRNA (guanine527-N7)-methyltransferase
MMKVDLIARYFDLSDRQKAQFEQLFPLYSDWNQKINVISRKNIDALYLQHVLHSLGVAKVIDFLPGAEILDVGTGGGFPGIPLAILFPETQFHLVDSIGKKLKVVNAVAAEIGLSNVKTTHIRAEQIKGQYDFIVSRAVTRMPDFVKWVKGKVKKQSRHHLKNGILYLKGGDLSVELACFSQVKIYDLKNYFSEEFFETKKVVYLPG